MPTGAQVWFVVGIVGVMWLALLGLAGISGQSDQVSKITTIVPALLVGASLFERFGWRWAPLHPHLVHTPIIRGTWRGELSSLWKDPQTGAHPASQTVYVTVEQTLTTVAIRLRSNESSSQQIAGTFTVLKATGERVIASTYVNTPKIELRERSRPHYGGVVLTVYGDPPTRLAGEYWTDRSTGSLDLRGYSPLIADSYEQAQSLTYREAKEGGQTPA